MTTKTPATTFASFNLNGAAALATSHVDRLVKEHLAELDALLGKKVLPSASFEIPQSQEHAYLLQTPGNGGKAGKPSRGSKAASKRAVVGDVMKIPLGRRRTLSPAGELVKQLLGRKLTPKYASADENGKSWNDESLAAHLDGGQDRDDNLGIAEFIDHTPALLDLKFALRDDLQGERGLVNQTARAVLDEHPNIRDYLIAYAYLIKGMRDASAVKNLILTHAEGVRRIANYAAISAARSMIAEGQTNVPGFDDDDSDFVRELEKSALPLSAASFRKSVEAVIRRFVFDSDEEQIIDSAGLGSLPEGYKPLLVKYIQALNADSSKPFITSQNAKAFLPHLVLQIRQMNGTSLSDAIEQGPLDTDFRVRFEDDPEHEMETSAAAVHCAAQMYHAMVLGDELDVFGAVNYLTNRRLLMNGGINIKSATLRKDLQDYVLNNEFVDLATGRRMNRTRPAERQMFYRQVFGHGNVQAPDDMPVNTEFQQLWKVLMVECARYLQQGQSSLHPDNFLSSQNIVQAVEDLQYNLTTTCTGMATIITPVADAELNFVLERILKHPEILRHIVPEGGTWKRAVDKLNTERRKRPGNAATLYNKAAQGSEILNAIASMLPGDLDDFAKLSAFVGTVDRFITTQSILQTSERGRRRFDHDVDEEEPVEREAKQPLDDDGAEDAAAAAVEAGSDEWDF